LGTKEFKLIYDIGGGRMVKNVPVPPDDRARFAITDDEILTLARWACVIEEHYSAKKGRPTAMDMEWAKDGLTGELFIVQARPETVQSQKDRGEVEIYHLTQQGSVLVTGRSVGDKIGRGPVRVIKSVQHIDRFKPGEVLVTDKTDPDWEPIMKKAAAIVTNRGGRTCHAAIVSRELGLPAVVGAEQATERLRDGQRVTVSCAGGETGVVYEGTLSFEVEKINLKSLTRPKTRVMMNLGNPQEAFGLSFIPNDGVGLAREEFIISTWIKIHPLALVNYHKLEDPAVKGEIDRLTVGYGDKVEYFVDRLAQGVGMIAAAFYPKDVIVRLMIPFCRTVEEGRLVQAEMNKHGLRRGANGLELYVMCEIPSNVILADAFAELFDGFSIGSNDLTQLVLGVDRDSEIVASLFDERNEAVKTMVATVIKAAKAKGRKIGICGQAPSDYPEFARFLVEQGIDSISLNPDAVMKTTVTIVETEKATGRK
jgi:pyruvate,water dikinase